MIVSPSGQSSFQIATSDALYYSGRATATIYRAKQLIDILHENYARGLTTAAESESIVSALDTLVKSYGAKRTAIADALLLHSRGVRE